MVGGFGMQAVIAGNTPGYVTDATPVNDAIYHARFYFNPRGTTSGNTQMTIFSGLNAANTTIFQVQYRRIAAGGGTYQVRLSVLRAGGTTNTNWFNITNNAANWIEIDWRSATSASIRLYVNSTTARQVLTLNTSAYRLDTVRLGPSVGLAATAAGTPYFDAFVSTRNPAVTPIIGP
jgi:hypothetical protein